jgi:hypothetical protein
MSDPTQTAGAVRPMAPADYSQGQPVPASTGFSTDHPTRDLIVGAIVGAFALWAVPKTMNYLTERFTGGAYDPDYPAEEYDLEVEPD